MAMQGQSGAVFTSCAYSGMVSSAMAAGELPAVVASGSSLGLQVTSPG
jgi:hypothetical protein